MTIDSLLVTGANNSVSIGNSTTIAEFDIRGDNATVSIGAHNRIEQLAASGSNGLVTIQSATSAVPSIRLSGSNTRIRVPAGYLAHTTITNTGVNNTVEER